MPFGGSVYCQGLRIGKVSPANSQFEKCRVYKLKADVAFQVPLARVLRTGLRAGPGSAGCILCQADVYLFALTLVHSLQQANLPQAVDVAPDTDVFSMDVGELTHDTQNCLFPVLPEDVEYGCHRVLREPAG